MSIFVDRARIPWRGMLMSHMWSDAGAEELHAFAARLGLRRAWFQCPPKASWEHYDVSEGVRLKALRLGAQETDRFGPLEHLARLRGDGTALERIASARARMAAAEAGAPGA